MEPETNLILIATIIMGSLMCGVIFWFHLKFKNEVREKEKALAAYKQGFSRTLQFGENQAMGKIAEQVADLEFYKEYDEVYILAATKGSPPVDRVGVKYEEKILDWIEIKKDGARLTAPENKFRRLVKTAIQDYKVKDVNLNGKVSVENRTLPKLRQQKITKPTENESNFEN